MFQCITLILNNDDDDRDEDRDEDDENDKTWCKMMIFLNLKQMHWFLRMSFESFNDNQIKFERNQNWLFQFEIKIN